MNIIGPHILNIRPFWDMQIKRILLDMKISMKGDEIKVLHKTIISFEKLQVIKNNHKK